MSVLFEVDAVGVAWLTLDRPALGNRVDLAVLGEMMRVFRLVAADGEVRCLVLRGRGKHFCVGADIDWHALDDGTVAEDGVGMLEMLLALNGLPIPVVGVVHGGCVGAGVGIASCCDVVLAERGAFFAVPEVRLGFCPGSLIGLLQRAMGARAVRRYAVSGERFSAETALRLGLVSELFDGDGEEAIRPVLEAMRLGAPGAIGATKRLNAAAVGVVEMRALEAGFGEVIQGEEAREGLAAFREKRMPNWFRGERA